jgi:uncharacterized membrane protein
MDSHKFWTIAHGGTTHFPIALLIASFVFDLIALFIKRDPVRRDLLAASYYSLLLGALGSFGAVLSGVMLTHWQMMGRGKLLLHHDFVWPAFGLIVALAVWRIIMRDQATRRAYMLYLIVVAAAAALMGAAGYWGG